MIELNKIYNEDCLEGMKRIPDKSVDLVVTDPPYLHVKGGMKSKKYNTGSWKSDSYMTSSMSDFGKKNIFNFLDIVIPKMKKVNIYIYCSKLQLVHYFEYISQHPKLKYDMLVWDKVKYSMKSTKFFTSDLEYIIRIYEPKVSLNKILTSDGSKSNINYYLKRKAFEQPRGEHNTMKPLDMIKQFVELSSNAGDLVLDPFLGSGTTAIAAINTKRNFIGFELNKEYFEIAQNRIEERQNQISLLDVETLEVIE